MYSMVFVIEDFKERVTRRGTSIQVCDRSFQMNREVLYRVSGVSEVV